jgi:RNA polymerase sigma-70 factor (ECF subfamily)
MASVAADLSILSEMVAGAQRGDHRAADQLVREHSAWIRSVIYGATGRPELVDDVAQQVWAQVWERIDSLTEPRRLRPWLYTIARNAAIDAGMSERRRERPLRPLESAEAQAGPGTAASGPVEKLIGDEIGQTVLEAIQSLPAIYREPFVLRHMEDWSYAEIGEVLGLPVETVETRLARARSHLREMLRGRLS